MGLSLRILKFRGIRFFALPFVESIHPSTNPAIHKVEYKPTDRKLPILNIARRFAAPDVGTSEALPSYYLNGCISFEPRRFERIPQLTVK